ncbi:MAG TPA: sigma-70 family RNA polymerase sigma factor [Candidatus Acidoferrum sp.]|nr:sigma-70 family RNA polymerase sigma factor [Candidatus Acidoferrum sp.]
MPLFSRKPRIKEFEAVALPHLHELFRTASRLLGDAARAEDAVQDVYLLAWKSFDTFETGTNCRAWLFHLLFHKLRHYRRKWLTPREMQDAEEVIGGVPAWPAFSPGLTDDEVLEALAAVSPEYRAVILLVDVEEFSYKDAAGILGVPAGTLMSRLSRARGLLRERLVCIAEAHGIGRRMEGKSA